MLCFVGCFDVVWFFEVVVWFFEVAAAMATSRKRNKSPSNLGISILAGMAGTG